MPINRYMEKQNINTQNGVFSAFKRNEIVIHYYKIHGMGRLSPKRNKPGTKGRKQPELSHL